MATWRAVSPRPTRVARAGGVALLWLGATVMPIGAARAQLAPQRLADWTAANCDPNTAVRFGWLVTWNNVRADPIEGVAGGGPLRPRVCDFWNPELRARVDADAFRLIFEAHHVKPPHDEDAAPNPSGVQYVVADAHLFVPPMPGQMLKWFFVPVEGGGANPGFIDHPTNDPNVKHRDTFGLWAVRTTTDIRFWFSGVHCGATALRSVGDVEGTADNFCTQLPPPPRLTSVPEPATLALTGLGLAALAAGARRTSSVRRRA